MKPKTLILMLVAVACGLAASFMTSRYLAAQHVAPVDEEVTVLLATKNLTAYARLNDQKLFEAKVVKKSEATKDSVGDFDRVKGRILKLPLAAGKQLAESDMIDASSATMEYNLEPGEVAMTVRATADNAGGGFILPKSKIDVIAYLNRGGDSDGPMTKTILQNKEVLAINHEMVTPDGTVNKQLERVTLRLKHDEAEQLGVYMYSGSLHIVLRRIDDNKIYETTGAGVGKKHRANQVGEVASSDPPATSPTFTAPTVTERPVDPVKPDEKPKGPHTLDIIIGSDVKRITFPDKDKPKDSKDTKDGKETKEGK